MIGLEVRFLAGRYHGTGWHQAHNEGIPEWPPSPWRVLRALVSAAYAEELPTAKVHALLEKLRGLPRYRLPAASEAHTRHYMPEREGLKETKTKIFDAFVAVAGGARAPEPLTIGWDAVLDDDERALLAQLARKITYLGRAESWAEVEVVEVADAQWNCQPDEERASAHTTTLLAPASAPELAAWAAEQPPPQKGPDVPRNLWDVLTFEGERYRGEGWSDVPGTQRARYVFENAPFRRAVVPRPARPAVARPTVARFAIRSAVLPRVEDALLVTERLREAAMSRSKKLCGDARPVFSGHGMEASDHHHAMYLATDEDGRRPGFIDHLTISARAGFDEEDARALQSLRRLWGKGGHDLELILVGLGQPSDFGISAPRHAPLLGASRFWQSTTPFIPTRHPKQVRGVEIDGIADQLRRACVQLIGAAPLEIEKLEPRAGRPEWLRFRRRRRAGGGRRGPDWAVGARLVFAEPVRGPIALGYGCHFGLGLFEAVEK